MNSRNLDLHKLNSITKYPSILTYHASAEKGQLKPLTTDSFEGETEIIVTEKIDGAGCRIILLQDGFFIGSREELLTHSGELLFNPPQGIVEGLRAAATELHERYAPKDDGIKAIFVEFYGGKVTATSKQYTNGDIHKTSWRMFDAFNLSREIFAKLMASQVEDIASWRDHGGQP